MGLEAVKSAFAQSYRLRQKHAARSLLVWMAFNVLDEPREGRDALTFFGGYVTAAIGLGFDLRSLDDPECRQAALTAVKRNLRELEATGLISKVSRSAPGKNAVWRLTLDAAPAVDNTPWRSNRGGQRQTGTGVKERPEVVKDRPVQGSKTDLYRGPTLTPRSEGPDLPEQPIRIERAHAHAEGSR